MTYYNNYSSYTRNLGTNTTPTIGFDRIFNLLDNHLVDKFAQSKYPPYNVVKKNDKDYLLEIAVAGFSKEDLSVTVQENILEVSGASKERDNVEFIHRGLGKRNFAHRFTLADTVEVKTVNLTDGILTIVLENVIPESKQLKKLEINSSIQTKPQLLNESPKESLGVDYFDPHHDFKVG